MKKVLIISYYWPPSGGSGVQRWLKFTKYLPEHNWKPIIYTPENPEVPVIDNSLSKNIPKEAEIIMTPITEPYSFYKKFTGQKKEEGIKAGFARDSKGSSVAQTISVWIRGNLFIPDARKFWIRPSVKYLSRYLKENPVDAIVSTGPPHSMHLIALQLRKQFDIPWIADFRDPWTNIDFYNDLLLTKLADKKHHRLEKRVLQKSDLVITVGKTMKEEFEAMGAKNVRVITNGYDDDDIPAKSTTTEQEFTLTHLGTINKSRNFDFFWKSIAEVIQENSALRAQLRVKLIGSIDYSVKESIEKYQLQDNVTMIDYLPHEEAVKHLVRSSVLLLFINNTPNARGVLTGKFFEYLSTQIPILAVGPEDGDVAQILNETSGGKVCGFDNEEVLKESLRKMFEQKGKASSTDAAKAEQYSRKNLTGKLVAFLEELQAR